VLDFPSLLSQAYHVASSDKLLRPREVANSLAISRSTVYRWFWEGKLKGIKFEGGTVRILESSLNDHLNQAA
jgi:excisionase family DNA binding protein